MQHKTLFQGAASRHAASGVPVHNASDCAEDRRAATNTPVVAMDVVGCCRYRAHPGVYGWRDSATIWPIRRSSALLRPLNPCVTNLYQNSVRVARGYSAPALVGNPTQSRQRSAADNWYASGCIKSSSAATLADFFAWGLAASAFIRSSLDDRPAPSQPGFVADDRSISLFYLTSNTDLSDELILFLW